MRRAKSSGGSGASTASTSASSSRESRSVAESSSGGQQTGSGLSGDSKMKDFLTELHCLIHQVQVKLWNFFVTITHLLFAWCVELRKGLFLRPGSSLCMAGPDRIKLFHRDSARQHQMERLVIMGDLNLPEIDYNKYSVKGDENSYQSRFFDLTQDLHLHQNIWEETRMSQGQEPSKLDYVFTKTDIEIYLIKYIAPFGLSTTISD